MKVLIEINCDNSAFDESAGVELSRILNNLAHRMYYVSSDEMQELSQQKLNENLFDRYGNNTGYFTICQ